MVVWIEIVLSYAGRRNALVTTCVVVWIEMYTWRKTLYGFRVTTCVVVWIEIFNPLVTAEMARSPPAWWCGLKLYYEYRLCEAKFVTTCVVVWIEISANDIAIFILSVTTCVVVWIEIIMSES